jgi:hypothetical protein
MKMVFGLCVHCHFLFKAPRCENHGPYFKSVFSYEPNSASLFSSGDEESVPEKLWLNEQEILECWSKSRRIILLIKNGQEVQI